MNAGIEDWGGRNEVKVKKKKKRKIQSGINIRNKPENIAIFQRNLYIDSIKPMIFCSSSKRYFKQAGKLEKNPRQPRNPKENLCETKELGFS